MASNAEQPFEHEQGKRDETVQLLAQGQKLFKRYRLVRVLGRGGMGVVWLARDEELERDVALKFLPESICHDKEAAADLKRETRRSLELTHPNIVRIYDFVHDDDRAAIAMEHIDGRTLSALKVERPNGSFEAEEIAPWVQQLCAALDYAHSVGRVVHQDLKPANLMVNSRGQLKVTDFGIARSIADSVSRVTAEDTVGGTLVFMSPQQLNGEKPSPANDIYSLGATIYDLLTSKPPFHTGSLQHQIENKVPPPMTERRSEFNLHGQTIPEAWEKTVAACLAKKPEDRPADAAEVASRLGLHHSPGKAAWMTKLPGRTRGGKFSALSRLELAVKMALFLVVLAVVAFVLFRDPANSSGEESTAASSPPRPEAKPKLPPPISLDEVGDRFTNSLGMVFVAVKPSELFFSIWETRVQDFEAFVKATKHDAKVEMISFGPKGYADHGYNWQNPGWEQGPTYPVVGVNRTDAQAFCGWLNEVEAGLGRLPAGFSYRLPTDAEWSLAVGLEAETGNSPEEKDGAIMTHYPWGGGWPPPPNVGNYDGKLTQDEYDFTSPVGIFAPNALGLYDMGGNVWEWCEDSFTIGQPFEGTMRGGSFRSSQPAQLITSRRRYPSRNIATRNYENGFRCVLAGPPLAASARTTELLSEMGFDDPATPRVLPAPLAGKSAAQPWENSLGMRFIPVGNVGFSIWETRVKDFAEFVRATGHNATANVASLTAQGWMVMGNDWQKPGFPQTDLHPVTCVNWHDAAAFCQWLTGRERKAGLLKSSQRYRMPTTNEWTLAYGGLRFPWGDAWPPPSDRVANLAGIEAIGNNWPANRGTIPDYNDNVPYTAEVGHFPANALGICDLAGNVWEWGFDWTNDARVQKVFCGGAWDTPNDKYLRSAFFLPMEPTRRNTTSGFRCVLEEVGGM